MAPRCWGLTFALLLAACSGAGNTLPASAPVAPPPNVAPSKPIYLQFVDRVGVNLYPSQWKGGNCWPLTKPPRPLPPGLPVQAYSVIPMQYNPQRCGPVSSVDFSVFYGAANPPSIGCHMKISYDANREHPYSFSARNGGGLHCFLRPWKTKAQVPLTIDSFRITAK